MSIVNNVKHRLENYPKLKKTAGFAYRNVKKIRPGHIMCAVMLTTMCMSRCSSVNNGSHKSAAEYMEWAYDKGVEHVNDSLKIVAIEEKAKAQRLRDSLRIVELENKIAADSMKYFHKIK